MVEERLRYAIRFLSRHSKDFSLKEWRQINNPNYTKLLTLPGLLDLLDVLAPDIPILFPEHLISNLWNQQAKGDFNLIFDRTMKDIADKNISRPKPRKIQKSPCLNP